MPNNDIANDRQTPQPLIPPSLAALYNVKPVAWSEKEADYDSLQAQILAELDPRDTIEFILVKDVADIVWEKQRLRNLQHLSVRANLPEVLWSLISEQYWQRHGKDRTEPDDYKATMIDKFRRLLSEEDTSEGFMELLAEYHLDTDTLYYHALRWTLRTSTQLAKAIADAERRFEQLLKTIAERRQSLAEQTRSLVDRYGAEDVAPQAAVLEGQVTNVPA